MKSRERVKMSINHKQVDRVPIDLGSMRSTGIATITKGLAKMYDFIQQLAYPEKEIRDLFHVDVIDAGQAFLTNDSEWRKWTLNDGSKCLIPKYLNVEIDKEGTVLLKNNDNVILGKKSKNSLYVDQSYWVYKDLPKIPNTFNDKDLVKQLWAIPSPPWHLNIFNDNDYKLFIDNIKKLHNETDYAIMLGVGCNLFKRNGKFFK